ncbi:MAG: methyl-accepting chemotaxis protein [Pseudomonadota bacterium]
MAYVMYSAGNFLNSARSSVLAGEVLQDGLEARLDAFRFRITGNADLADVFAQNVQEVAEVSAQIHAGADLDEEALARLDTSDQLIAQYGILFDKIVDLRAPRNALVDQKSVLGRQIGESLTEIMDTASRDGDPVAAALAGRAQEQVLLARLYVERFLLTNMPEHFDRSQAYLDSARTAIDGLLVELQNPRRRTLAQNATADIEQFSEAGTALKNLIIERNRYRAEMDVLGPRFIASVSFVMNRLTQQQEAIGAELMQVGIALIAVLVVASALVLVFARRNTTRTSTYIKGAIDRFVVAMTDLANGKLEIDLGRPPDMGTELARMAEALAIFRDNALERIALQKKQAEQERQQLEEREAQRVREDDAKEAAQRQIEEERTALLDRLERSVGGVVEHAARGDFTQEITIDFEEESLRRMAQGINQLVRNVNEGLLATGKVMSALSKGDLTETMTGDFEGAFADLQGSTNGMISELRQLVGQISGSSEELSSSSNELKDTSDVLSRQAEQNAAALEETSAALEELTASIKQVSDNVADASQNAREASGTAQSSSDVAAEAAAAMTRISDASKEIANVVTVINDISFQINLLALNAGVEAARAGDAGRGFSVVAFEVRELAQRAGEAAKAIDEVITRSDAAVSEGVAKVTGAQESFGQISESVVGVSERIEQISNAITEQVHGIGEINAAVAQIDGNTQKQAASFEEVAAASTLLSNEAEGLKRSTSGFKTGRTVVALTPASKGKKAAPAPLQKAVGAPVEQSLDDADGWAEF